MIEFTDAAVPNASVIAYLTAAGFLSLILCYLAPLIGRALGLMDDPGAKAHSLHARPTPLIGGFAVVLPSVLLSSACATSAGCLIGGGFYPLPSEWVCLLVATLMLVGAVDDRVQLSASKRLAIMVPTFIIFTYLKPTFSVEQLTAPVVGISVTLGYLAAPFSALCLLALTNAVNMADGRNGLVIGLSLIWTLTLSFYLPEFLRVPALGVSVSLLVTGIYNLKGRLFLGDSGTYSLAALVGLMGLYVHNLTPQAGGISSTQLAALFAIPGLDMFRLMYVRAARGASPMSSDHDHLHHRLERRIGWNWGLPVYLAMAGGPILIACSTPNMGTPGLISASLLYCAAIFVTREQRQRFGDRSGAAANSE